MRIGKSLSIFIAVLTVAPFLYFVLFAAFLFSAMAKGFNHGQQAPPFLPYLMVVHLGCMLLMFALMAFYIVHIFKNPALPDTRRILWVIVIFMGSVVGAPIYWWLYLRPGTSTLTPPSNHAIHRTAR